MKNFFYKLTIIAVLSCAPCLINSLIIDVTFPGVPLEKNAQGEQVPTVRVGEQFNIKVVVASNEAEKPSLDSIEGLDKLTISNPSRSEEMSMSFSSVSGNVVEQKDIYGYTAVALQKGVEKIGPVHVIVGGKRYRSGAYYYQVLEAPKANPQAQRVVGSPAPVMARQGNQALIQCHLSASQTKVFVGGAFEVSLLVYRSGPQINYEVPSVEFPGFALKLGKALAPREETHQGKVFEVREQKIIVTPLQTGNFQLGPIDILYYARVKASPHDLFANFFNAGMGIQQKTLQSNPVAIEVVPLPHYAGRVDAVGVFNSFQAAVDKNEVVINEPVKLTLTVEGSGDLASIEEPKLLLPAQYRFYKSKATVHENENGGGRKVFEFVVQVPKPGIHEIPPQKFVYFDTVQKQYKTLISHSVELKILPDPESTQQAATSLDVVKQEALKEPGSKDTVFQDDVSFIEESSNFGPSAARGFPWWLLLVLMLLPLVFVRDLIALGLKRFILRGISPNKQRQLFIKKAEQELNQLVVKRDAALVHPFFVQLCKRLFMIEQHEAADAEIEKKLYEVGWDFVKIQDFLDYLSASASLNFIAKNDEAIKTLVLKKAHYWFLLVIEDAPHKAEKAR